ncbi:MAG TPA: Holliday junction branch migration protein RuvA [Phnomibacter sp.]|nr:Holliday junction branch migration protein RuvA [Phnomibacter sp.]
MIAQLTGKFLHKSPTKLIVDVQGVGYEVQISLNTFAAIQHADAGTLITHLKVAEDAFTIFGFSEPAEKDIFLKLLSVSGVGAATARMMLSSMRPIEVAQAISTGQVRILEGVKGIGKKTAERIVLELKDKMGSVQMAHQPTDIIAANNTPDRDALDALVALGIARNMAEQAIKKALVQSAGSTSVEELIKLALKAI